MNTDIKSLLSKIGKTQETWKTKLIQEWASIIGMLSDKIILERIEENILILGVTHPAWIQEFSSLKPLIINTINSRLDQPKVSDIRFKIVTFRVTRPYQNQIRSAPVALDRSLSAQEQKAISRIKDEELKKVLISFLQRCGNT